MKYSYNWLKELSGTKKSPDQLAKLLMMHAFEVEEVVKYAHGLDGVVVGKVESLETHPNADRLRVAQVRVSKNQVQQIVCGAPNIEAGQLVAVILPGGTLPGGVEISEVKLRGILSQGMVCSPRELGLGESHEGILVLPEDAPVGAYFAKHYGLDDTILDIKILPDRGGDALSHEGMAREIAALDGYAPRFTENERKRLRIPAYNRAPKVTIQDKKASSRYSGVLIRGVVVKESPLWLQTKLIVLGIKPKNTIVDVTNYLMLLSGQPIHAFDADKIEGGVVVRRAKKGEKLRLLSGESIKLQVSDIVIADSKKVLALAGVMGGASSAVTEKTTNIFVEVAVFDSSSIRKTKQTHNLPTDASYRFERGVSLELASEVLPTVVSLYTEYAEGKLFGMRDVRLAKPKAHKIILPTELVEDVLGVRVPLFEIVRLLALLGLKVRKKTDKDMLEVTIPERRPDLRDAWNLIEEIGRMRGYDKIASEAPSLPLGFKEVKSTRSLEFTAKEHAALLGFDEIMTYSFYSTKDIEASGLDIHTHAMLESPLSPEYTHLRQSLIPLFLRKAKENLRHFENFAFFEIGSVFLLPNKKMLSEWKEIAFLEVTKPKSKTAVVLDLKEKVVSYLQSLGIEDIAVEPGQAEGDTFFHPTRAALIKLSGVVVGSLGEIHPVRAKSFGLPEGRVAVATLRMADIEHAKKKEIVYEAPMRFPYATRDITLWFPKSVNTLEARRVIKDGGGELLKASELFDTFEKDGERSYSFHLSFGAPDRTLTTEEMDVSFDTIVTLAKERHEGYIRH